MATVYIFYGNNGSGYDIAARRFFNEQRLILNMLTNNDVNNYDLLALDYNYDNDCCFIHDINILIQSINRLLPVKLESSFLLYIIKTNHLAINDIDLLIQNFGANNIFIKIFNGDLPTCKLYLQYLENNNYCTLKEIFVPGINIEYCDIVKKTNLQLFCELLINEKIINQRYIDYEDKDLYNLWIGYGDTFAYIYYNVFVMMCSKFNIPFDAIRDFFKRLATTNHFILHVSDIYNVMQDSFTNTIKNF